MNFSCVVAGEFYKEKIHIKEASKEFESSPRRSVGLLLFGSSVKWPQNQSHLTAFRRSLEPATLLKPKEEAGLKTQGAVGIVLKQKHEVVTKSAVEILNDQHRNSAPAARLAMTRRVRPLVSLNPY
ncbi:hypothetical protein LR48_Vigan04g068200 [Vigna angularis]|uniref:Uncharacterized protein n=1 Tax=Phaseolus angularis TaxID=3914 RepID=A0A0L9UD94_PHAAN|nr:hypothetical protein LR48_Vigan04g068200 [Vigna angularis]